VNTGKFAIILSQCYNAHTRVKLVELVVIACFQYKQCVGQCDWTKRTTWYSYL